jgi:hypothetical protein
MWAIIVMAEKNVSFYKDPPSWTWLFVLVGWFSGTLVGWLVSLLVDYWLVSHLVCYSKTISAAEFIIYGQ